MLRNWQKVKLMKIYLLIYLQKLKQRNWQKVKLMKINLPKYSLTKKQKYWLRNWLTEKLKMIYLNFHSG